MKNITIERLLAFEEGFRSEPFIDTEDYPTIGIGQKIGRKGDPLECYTFTVNMEVATAMLESHLDGVYSYLANKYEEREFIGHNQARHVILTSMAYQIGTSGLDKFKNMWKAIEQGDWETASKEAIDSRWAKQTPERANRHAEVLRTGEWTAYENLI